ncbi:C-type lectin domain family 14 member A [Gouania willdenowi]|uniref:C-type lectin domain family 14 member A n=1 Tax=Gouania willdenowi TaxID=441366 RepID=UPI001054FF6C|nr:complement component C1q receptor-like [Gouania willdenowi]
MEASLWFLGFSLAVVSSSPRYVLHLIPSSFDEANKKCLPGTLTSLWSREEVGAVLALLSDSENQHTLWVGLRKDRTACVDPALPLRGFRWTAGGGPQSMVSRWGVEPKPTCTAVRCAALSVHRTSPEPDWSLNPISCRHAYPFICKIPAENGTSTSTTPEPEPGPGPSTPAAEPTSFGPSVSEPLAEFSTAKPEPEPSKQAAEPKPSEPNPPELPGGPTPPPDPCGRPVVPGSRSLSLDPEDPGRILVECWSSVRVDLFCGGQPMTWRLQNRSKAELSTVCSGCFPGFQQAASGQCEDVDECVSGPCENRTCLNTHGTFRCVCDGRHDDGSCDPTETQDQQTSSTVLVPVLVAIAALVVLVTVVVVMVICCCRRRRSLNKRANEE